jgi:hypothetical protein
VYALTLSPVELPGQIADPTEIVADGLAVVIPVKSLVVLVTAVEVSV